MMIYGNLSAPTVSRWLPASEFTFRLQRCCWTGGTNVWLCFSGVTFNAKRVTGKCFSDINVARKKKIICQVSLEIFDREDRCFRRWSNKHRLVELECLEDSRDKKRLMSATGAMFGHIIGAYYIGSGKIYANDCTVLCVIPGHQNGVQVWADQVGGFGTVAAWRV